jgi:hypothetical protein
VIGGGFIDTRLPRREEADGFLQLGALGGEADFGEAQEDEAENGSRSIPGA